MEILYGFFGFIGIMIFTQLLFLWIDYKRFKLIEPSLVMHIEHECVANLAGGPDESWGGFIILENGRKIHFHHNYFLEKVEKRVWDLTHKKTAGDLCSF